jgi:hypothetical protein
VYLYGLRPEKWTAAVFEAILAQPGATWREAVDNLAAAATMDNLAAAGKGHEHEPT